MNKKRSLIKDWLTHAANTRCIKGLHWLDDQHTLLRVPWNREKHEEVAMGQAECIFYQWAVYTGTSELTDMVVVYVCYNSNCFN